MTEINPTVKKWVETWANPSAWSGYGLNTPFVQSNLHYSATLGGNYYTGPYGGSPQKRWDRSESITARIRFIRNGSNWAGFSLYAGEAEYCGFSISSSGSVGFYCNAAYTYPGTFTAANGQAVELQMEFDGNETFVFKARNLDLTDTAAWSTLGTLIFKPVVNPTLQINQEGASGTALFGQIEVTGSEVWQFHDVADMYWYFPTHTNTSYEWGIEYNNLSVDAGVQHYLTMAGGLTLVPSNGATNSWIQGTASTPYPAGSFNMQSQVIAPAPGFKYSKIELIAGLRQGAGNTLTVAIRKSDGSLVPSSQLGGASNPVVFSQSASVQLSVSASSVVASGIYFDVQGYAASGTAKLWPDSSGLTGPPILKQAAVTFEPLPPLYFSTHPTVQAPTDDGGVIAYGTADPTADDVTAAATSFASASTVATFREAATAIISAGVSASSTQQMLESVFTAAQSVTTASTTQSQVESLLAQITAFPTVTDILTLADKVVQPFIFTAQPSVSMLTGDGGIIAYGTADTGADDVTSYADVSASLQDIVARIESLITIIQAVPTVADVMAQIEAVTTTTQATTQATDVQLAGVAESLLTATAALATVNDVQMMVNGVITVADSGAGVTAVAQYLESVTATATAQVTVTDMLIALLETGPHEIIALLSPITLQANLISQITRKVERISDLGVR